MRAMVLINKSLAAIYMLGVYAFIGFEWIES